MVQKIDVAVISAGISGNEKRVKFMAFCENNEILLALRPQPNLPFWVKYQVYCCRSQTSIANIRLIPWKLQIFTHD